MKKIKKEYLLDAIKEIDNTGIAKHNHSFKFDVYYNNKWSISRK